MKLKFLIWALCWLFCWSNGGFAASKQSFPSWMDEVDFNKSSSSSNSKTIDLEFTPSRFQTKIKNNLPDFEELRKKSRKTQVNLEVDLEERIMELFAQRKNKEKALAAASDNDIKQTLAGELKSILDEIEYIRGALAAKDEAETDTTKK
jgi:tryptophanyl-tRNA synthetase